MSFDPTVIKHILLGISLLGLWGTGFSQTEDFEPDTLQLEEVRVQSTRTGGNLLRQAAALAILRKAELERDAGIAITPALNRVPGVYMQSGALNTNRITIRGIGSRSLFSTNKVRAYLDDIPLTGGDGETTLEDIDPSVLGKIEIIKGPASSIFGAGLGGVINLYSEHPGVNHTQLSTELMAGSYGLLRQVHQFRHSEAGSAWLVNFNDTHSDSYRENNTYDRTALTVLGRLYQEKSKTTVLGSWIALEAFIPSSLDSANFASNPQRAAFTWGQVMGFEDYSKALIGISHQQKIHSNWELVGSIFGNFRSSYELRPFNILKENNQSLGTRSYLNYQRPNWDLKLGGEYYWENYTWQTNEQEDRQISNLLSDQQEIRRFYNLFLQTNFQLSSQLQLTSGLNFNNSRYTLQDFYLADSIDQSGTYSFDPQLSPRLALLYAPSPTQSFFVQASHGFSPPSVEETLMPDGAINPDIQPETGWNFELGTKGFFQERLRYEFSAFYMAIQNLLVARRTDFDQFIGINAGASSHAGIEASLDYQISSQPSRLSAIVFANANFGRYRFEDFVDEDQDYSGNSLTGVPSSTLNAGIDIKSRIGFFVHLNGRYVSEMPLRDDNSIYSDAFFVMNSKIGWKESFLKSGLFELYGGINNLLDASYASMILPNAGSFGGRAPRYYYPGLPRNYYAGIKISWRFN